MDIAQPQPYQEGVSQNAGNKEFQRTGVQPQREDLSLQAQAEQAYMQIPCAS